MQWHDLGPINMDPRNPRYSTSEALLEVALEHSRTTLACETRIIRLRDLKFRACEGYYSKNAHACTWPCSITEMDDARPEPALGAT